MSFSEAVYTAVGIRNREDSRAALHDIVGAQLHKLDPGARVKATDYFNHTFVPDFEVAWSREGALRTRDIFLRLDVSSADFLEERTLLEQEGAFVLGVYDERALDSSRDDGDSELLVTQARAVDELDEDLGTDGRSVEATREIVRSGKGSINTEGAERIGAQFLEALSKIDLLRTEQTNDAVIESVRGALQILGPVLTEEGGLQVEQSLRARWIREGGAPSLFPGTVGWNPKDLDDQTLKAILLDLLEGDASGIDPSTWTELAGHVSSEDIGRLLEKDLLGQTFNAMAKALAPGWTTKWVWSEAGEQTESMLPGQFTWLVSNGMLGLDVNGTRYFFTDDGRHFKDKPEDSALPILTNAAALLSREDVRGVALRGVKDDLELTRREGLQSIGEAIGELLSDPGQEGLLVTGVTVAVPETERHARVEFGSRKIDFRGEPTDIRRAADLGARFLSQHSESELEDLAVFLRAE